jgi:hypothetical protein
MRGIDHQQADMFSYLSPEARVRKDHPLRAVGSMMDEILSKMSPLFDAMYAEGLNHTRRVPVPIRMQGSS